jgi:AcrR family transcriptional regulator
MVDADPTASPSRAERREKATADTRLAILAAARACLLADGYANLSTRAVAEAAGVPLSQIHYHFGSKRQLILAVLEAENVRLLERQREMFDHASAALGPLGARVRLPRRRHRVGLCPDPQEMIAAGWSDRRGRAAPSAA